MAVGDMENLKRIISHTLVNDDTIDAFIKGRLFSHHLQDPDLTQIEYPMIVTAFRSGRAHYTAAVQADTMELWAYSRLSAGEATKIYDAAFTVLQANKLTIAGLAVTVVAQEIERPNEGWSETTRAWFAEGRWLIRAVG